MRIAIIGTGISGLTAAHLLHPEHEIVVYEAGDHVGGHANTVRVDTEDATWQVDTGFIVLNDRNYPRFEALLDQLGVARQPTDMSFSVSAQAEDFEYSSGGVRGVVAQPSNLARPRFLRMVADYVRFNRAARALLADPGDERSLGAFLEDEGFSRWFIERLLVPQAAAVWSADPEQMWSLPARFLVAFFAHHGMLSLTGRPQWSTIAGGSARYVEALTAPFADRIRVRTPIAAVTRHPTHVEVVPHGESAEEFDERSLGAFLEDEGFSRWFVERLLVPQAAAVWSADPAQMWSFPARFLVAFFAHHGMLSLTGRPQWSTIAGGSARYVEALTAPFADRIRVRTPIAAVTRHPTHVEIVPHGESAEEFDEVVIAAHADQALGLLTDPSAAEAEILGAFGYQPNEAVLHTDRAMLPRRRAAWAAWNYHLLAEPRGRCAVTYYMNHLQSLEADRPFCVTLNRTAAIAPERVIRVIPYAHPVFTREAMSAQRRHAEISGVSRTHYCGAYWRWGFHEDGVVSAHDAVARMRERVPAPPLAPAQGAVPPGGGTRWA